jgi:hypothetical protein
MPAPTTHTSTLLSVGKSECVFGSSPAQLLLHLLQGFVPQTVTSELDLMAACIIHNPLGDGVGLV